MFRYYLTISLRNILNNKLFSTVNIAGLSIGLSAVMLITLYVWDELTFDRHLSNKNNLYKLELKTDFPGRGEEYKAITAGAVSSGLKTEYPDLIKRATRLRMSSNIITVGDLNISEEITRADPSFFEIFDLEYIAGNAETASPDMSTVALSEAMAIKYFGDTNNISQTLQLDDGKSYRVGAIYKNFPRNTHIRPNFIFPLPSSNDDLVSEDNGWWNIGYNTYVELPEGMAVSALQHALSELVNRHLGEIVPGKTASSNYNYKIIPFHDVHFETAASDAGNPTILAGFAAIALIILSIATFNFLNMTLSRTVTRAREVAIRKVFGAGKLSIIGLILCETLVTVAISLIIAAVMTEMSLVWFNDFVTKVLTLGALATPTFMGALILLIALIAVGAGFYPASLFARSRPAKVLGGGRSNTKAMSRLGTLIVTVQFAVAIALIIASTVIYQQIQYSQNMDLGYDKENLLLISGLGHPSVNPSVQNLKHRLSDHPDITSVALTDQAPGGTYGWMESVTTVDGKALPQRIAIRGMIIDQNFTDTFGMKLAAGRMLSQGRSSDFSRRLNSDYAGSYNIVINESAVQTLGLGSAVSAVGKTLGENGAWTIVGVIADYHIGSSKKAVPPMMFNMDEQGFQILALRFQTNNLSKLMADIDTIWEDIVPHRPIRSQFMDDRLSALYQVEQQQGQIFTLFASLAVLVSCIGLYGLVAFSVAKRTKEIGIRKVLGASTAMITRKIIWDFSKPVLIANIIAWPIAGLIMRNWLTNFSYHIELSVTPFLAAAALVLVSATLTVGSHAVRAARAKPINALQHT